MWISLPPCLAVQVLPVWTTGGWGLQDMLKSKLPFFIWMQKVSLLSMVSYWGRNKKGNFTVGCMHRTCMDKMCVTCPSTDKMETFVCFRNHSSRCESCLGARESNKTHQVFRNDALGKHWAFKCLTGSCKGGNLCFPCPLEQKMVQIIVRQIYLGLC